MSRRTAGWWLLWVGCASGQVTRAPAVAYPTALVAPRDVPGDWLRRQQLVARYPTGAGSFEAVLQKQGPTLTLIALAPFGAKAFVLVQTGTEVRFTAYLPVPLPFPPRFILNDISRTYFGGIAGGPFSDGEQVRVRDGERISERWQAGRLLERRFVRVDRDPPGEIVITYVGGMREAHSPALIELDNGWLGYHLSIATLSEQPL